MGILGVDPLGINTLGGPVSAEAAITVSPNIVSSTVTVHNAALIEGGIISVSLVSATATVPDLVVVNLFTVVPDLVSEVATVNTIALTAGPIVSPDLVTAAVSVSNPSLLDADVLSPDTVSATVAVDEITMLIGPVTLLPLGISKAVSVYNVKVTDPFLEKNFYSNDTMIKYFRTKTGLDSYQFNELAIAWYSQVASTDPEAFNDLQKAAQDAEGFVGLAPTDWRNF